MPIPDSLRVVYEKNPLVEVICQLRYPTVFKIGIEAPVQFQEVVRTNFPIAQQKQIVSQVPPELLSLLPEGVSRNLPSMPAYDFTTRDGAWTITLTRDFVALTTRNYERWEGFRDRLQIALNALQEAYSVPFFVRVGLRYQDVISPSVVQMPNVAWSELLNPYIAGELADDNIAGDVRERLVVSLLQLKEYGAFVRLQHGLVMYQSDTHKQAELCYLIDADLYTERQTEVHDVWHVLSYLNRQAGNLFRWCISEHLHRALQPRPLEARRHPEQ